MTHSDYDHVDALELFPNAAIFMSEDELPLINGTVKRNFFGSNKLPLGVNIEKIIRLPDAQELVFHETKIKCIKAPGHTIGSMAFLINDQYLFSGDAFKIKKGKMGVHPFTMNTKLSKKTIEQLKGIINKSPIVFTAHYGYLEN